jgi:DNA replication protein DnaC
MSRTARRPGPPRPAQDPEGALGRRSTIVTSQAPVADWHDVIDHPTFADAILDRLVHSAHRLELAADSLRRMRRAPATA